VNWILSVVIDHSLVHRSLRVLCLLGPLSLLVLHLPPTKSVRPIA